MKKEDAIAALKIFMDDRCRTSMGKFPTSSAKIGSSLSDASTDVLLQQFKAKVFSQDLFEAIKKDLSIVNDIRNLMEQLSGLRITDPATHFLLEFKVFLNHIHRHFKMKKNSMIQLK